MHLRFLQKLALSALLITFFFCSANSTFNYKNKTTYPPGISTLDSLQGTWINEDDTLEKVIINDRYWKEDFNDPDYPDNTYRIYFSDTAVISNTFTSAHFDTSQLSGNYIILRSQIDNSIDCSEILGIVTIQGETFFSKWPAEYGTMSSTRTYKKK